MSASQGINKLLFTGLIATLPLFSVRFLPGGLSIPFLFLLALAVSVLTRMLTTLRFPVVLSTVDRGLLLYIIAALATLTYAASTEAVFAIFKSVIYFLSYLAMKMALAELPGESVKSCVRRGLVGGTLLFSAIALLALQRTGSLNVLSQSFNYSGGTVRVFSAIDEAFGQGRTSFASVDVMRNSVGEAFALYAILSLALRFRNPIMKAVTMGINILFTLGMYSRRAMLAAGLGILGVATQRGVAARLLLLICILLVATLFVVGQPEDSRLTDFSDEARTAQYVEALHRFGSSPLLGDGYGAKLESGQYVHNFIFAGMMMMGILGLIATLLVFLGILSQYLRGLLRPDGPWTSPLLIVPILGMAVGSTVEGIMTITGWVALALHDNCRQRAELEQQNNSAGQNG